jgi:hypothetical protein
MKKHGPPSFPYLLANVSGSSSLNELSAAVPADEIVEHDKDLHTVVHTKNNKLNM